MTYNYFKCLHSFAFENKDKKHDIVFTPPLEIINWVKHPVLKADRNPAIIFHRSTDYFSDLSPRFSFSDIFELWDRIGSMIIANKPIDKIYNDIGDNIFLCLKDVIEVHNEDDVTVDKFEDNIIVQIPNKVISFNIS